MSLRESASFPALAGSGAGLAVLLPLTIVLLIYAPWGAEHYPKQFELPKDIALGVIALFGWYSAKNRFQLMSLALLS